MIVMTVAAGCDRRAETARILKRVAHGLERQDEIQHELWNLKVLPPEMNMQEQRPQEWLLHPVGILGQEMQGERPQECVIRQIRWRWMVLACNWRSRACRSGSRSTGR